MTVRQSWEGKIPVELIEEFESYPPYEELTTEKLVSFAKIFDEMMWDESRPKWNRENARKKRREVLDILCDREHEKRKRKRKG